MRLQTIDSSQITWTIYPSDSWQCSAVQYCADGDGMVEVKLMRDGVYLLDEQGDKVAEFTTLAEALEAGQELLKRGYTWAFEESQHNQGEAA